MENLEYVEDVEDLQDKLLGVIEEGDAVDVLAEEYTASLNELMKFELIEIRDDKLRLTEKGRQARLIGVKNCVKLHPVQEEKTEIIKLSDVNQDSNNRSLLIVLFFLLISLAAIIVLMNF